MKENEHSLLTAEEAAKTLRVSRRTLGRLDLPVVRIGNRRLYRRSDVTAFIDERTERTANAGLAWLEAAKEAA